MGRKPLPSKAKSLKAMTIPKIKTFNRPSFWWVFGLTVVLSIASFNAFSQSGGKKAKARIGLQYFNLGEQEQLVATVKSKIEGKYQRIENVKVNFYREMMDEGNLLGSAVTDEQGNAILVLHQNAHTDSSMLATYIAAIENSDRFRDKEDEIYIKKAFMKMELEEEDSVKWAHIFVGSPDEETGEILPAPDVEITILIKRLLGTLPISEDVEYTDEEGYVHIEFPSDFPGDKNGNLILIAQVNDHEEYGNLEIRKTIAWGIPVSFDPIYETRELWSARANAPLSLILIVNSILIGVWGILIYIVFQFSKIYKLGNNITPKE